jgi:dihydrofolate reductase
MSENRVIGKNNTLPWRLPEDLKYFKRTTMGSSVIMGRKTWDSIGKVLPGRTNIIVTRSPTLQIERVKMALSVPEAIELAEHAALIDGSDEAFIIGGAELYSEAMPFADRFYLTRVHAEVEGDTFLQSFDEAAWREISRKEYRKSDLNPLDYSICVLDKKK